MKFCSAQTTAKNFSPNEGREGRAGGLYCSSHGESKPDGGFERETDEQAPLGETLRAYQDQKYQQEISSPKNETQLDTLKEKLWDEFEISYAQAMTFKKKSSL